MFTISKEFHFSACHKLNDLPKGHPCSQLHGHNYVVRVILANNSVNDSGFVQDYNELSPIKEYIDTVLDHKNLNDVFDFNPTVENMSKYIYHKFMNEFRFLRAVEMSETPKTWCRYEP